MIRELVYTSAPKGLKPGSQGFCTVVATKGLPDLLRERAEALSGYRVAFPAHSAQAGLNPVAWSHLAWSLGGSRLHILSRVGHAGLDFEGRINKIAHHLLLEPSDLVPAGPAWLLAQPGVMRAAWDGRIGWLPADRVLPHGDVPPRRCSAWEGATGDPGWAGMLAESFLDDPSRPAFLEFTPGRDLLPLVAEAIALLPPERRWDVTFSTYYTGLPQDISCAWRGVLRDSPEALQARLTPGALVVPIEPRGRAPESSFRGLVSFARTGTPPLARAATPPPSPGSQPFQPDWGFSEPPALGDPATPYGLVEEAEPKRGRKLGAYRRDPSKPPPLFRQTGVEERSKRWMVWMAAAVVLLVGVIGGGLWLWKGSKSESAKVIDDSTADSTNHEKLAEKKNAHVQIGRGSGDEGKKEFLRKKEETVAKEQDKPERDGNPPAIANTGDVVDSADPGLRDGNSGGPLNPEAEGEKKEEVKVTQAIVFKVVDWDVSKREIEFRVPGVQSKDLMLELYDSEGILFASKVDERGRSELHLYDNKKEFGQRLNGIVWFGVRDKSIVMDYSTEKNRNIHICRSIMNGNFLVVREKGGGQVCGAIWLMDPQLLKKREKSVDLAYSEFQEGVDYVSEKDEGVAFCSVKNKDYFVANWSSFGFIVVVPVAHFVPSSLLAEWPLVPVDDRLSLGLVNLDCKGKQVRGRKVVYSVGTPMYRDKGLVSEISVCKKYSFGENSVIKEIGKFYLKM